MTPSLWVVAVELVGPKSSHVVHAAIDTGATTTLIPPEALVAIGCDPALSAERAQILTVSGREYLALVRVPKIFALGHRFENLQVMSHAMPFSTTVNALLGMDFLLQLPDFQRLNKRFQKFFV
jgi:predicted aspartyl protease